MVKLTPGTLLPTIFVEYKKKKLIAFFLCHFVFWFFFHCSAEHTNEKKMVTIGISRICRRLDTMLRNYGSPRKRMLLSKTKM